MQCKERHVNVYMYIYGKLSNIKDISHKMSDEDVNEFEDDYAFKKTVNY